MNTQSDIIPTQSTQASEINRLPSANRKEAASGKYAKAVRLYAATTLPLKTIAQLTGVSPTALSAHLSKHHRELLFARYDIPQTIQPIPTSTLSTSISTEPSTLSTSTPTLSTKVKSPKGQSAKTYLKYKDAIKACSEPSYIELTISEIARIFQLNPTALTAQLKYHFPEILSEREKMRQRLGITDNKQRGPRPASEKTYAEAVQLYRDTDLTLPEVAEKCNVPLSGLSQYLRFYHKEVISAKADRRKQAEREPRHRIPGTLAGNGSLYGPKPSTIERYTTAMELYRTTSLTLDQIADTADVPPAGFSGYLKEWQREEIEKRHRHGAPQAAEKYAQAIKSLKENPRAVAKVAEEFKLNPDVFREYLKQHEPELHNLQGMAIRDDGKRVKRSSQEKYHKAIEEYATSPKTMKEIAENHGLVYKSLMSFMKRNCPEAIERHRKST
ncbi:MAG: hypothetical protein K2H60_14235 [Muribaculaceae bacterium]|nr:hypothetical protein [Muribaculaceae bacterium]